VEHSQGKIDPMHSHPPITITIRTTDLHVVEGQVLQLVDSPRCEHDPSQDGVDEEEEGIGNTGGDTSKGEPGPSFTFDFEAELPITALPTHATYCRARSCTATARSKSYDLLNILAPPHDTVSQKMSSLFPY
jgi:hypothetical protein